MGDVLGLRNGRGFKTREWGTSGRPIIRIQNLKSADAGFNYFDGELPEHFAAQPGDLLFAWSGTPGTSFGAHIWNGPVAWINQHIFRVDFSPGDFDRDFLRFALDANLASYIDQAQGGVGLAHITKAKLNDSVLLAPPVAEQRHIARRLDQVQKRHASAAMRLTAARAGLEGFRLAVLAAGCSGRLTKDWRERRGLVGGGELPSGWTQDTVQGLAASEPRAIQSGPFGSNLKHSEFQTDGKLVIGIDNVLDGTFALGREHRISDQKFAELKKYEARPLDVLITVMATIGRVCVVPADIEPAIITKHVYRITVDQDRVAPHFLMLALRGHPKVREQIHHQTRGQTRPGINGQIVKALTIALPSLAEQQEIVRRVDAMMATARRLAARIDRANASLDRVPQASLAKAFRGELVPIESPAAADEDSGFATAEKG